MQDFSIYLPGIIMAYTAFLLAIASPGPNILAVIGTSMSVGRGSGIALALGVAFGSFTWGVLTIVGLSALLSTYANALLTIKIFGGLYFSNRPRFVANPPTSSNQQLAQARCRY